jgi:hypothetical protein
MCFQLELKWAAEALLGSDTTLAVPLKTQKKWGLFDRREVASLPEWYACNQFQRCVD